MVRCAAVVLAACLLNVYVWGFDESVSKALAETAVSADSREADEAIDRLRALGPPGLQALFTRYPGEVEALRKRAGSNAVLSDETLRVRKAIDRVAQQLDAYSSGLYWYTDLERAKKAAQQSGKPLLVLRMLGNLTDDCSCANSRFFRTALYANKEVSTYMREHFVLAWSSERPVPKITIDFGDGRKLERTITGNSVHYVLDSNGIIVDALPGLYGPGAFLRVLKRIESVAKKSAQLMGEDIRLNLLAYHSEQSRDLSNRLLLHSTKKVITEIEQPRAEEKPSAEAASKISWSKKAVEIPLLPAGAASNTTDVEKLFWEHAARDYAGDAVLDENSRFLMRAKYPVANQTPEGMTTAMMERIIVKFEASIALDTARNELKLHLQIHNWLGGAEVSRDVDALNKRVYKELFLTPREDPWLGLVPEATYTGLENEGLAWKQ